MYIFNRKYFASINRIIISGLALSFMLIVAACGDEPTEAPQAPESVAPGAPTAPTSPQAPVSTEKKPPPLPEAELIMDDPQDLLASLVKYEAFSFGLDGPLLKEDERYFNKADLQVFFGLKREDDKDKLVFIAPELKSKISEDPNRLRDALFGESSWQEDLPTIMLMILKDPIFKITTAYNKGLAHQNIVYSGLDRFEEYTLYSPEEEVTEITNSEIENQLADWNRRIKSYHERINNEKEIIEELDEKVVIGDVPLKSSDPWGPTAEALHKAVTDVTKQHSVTHPMSVFTFARDLETSFADYLVSGDKEKKLAVAQVLMSMTKEIRGVRSMCEERSKKYQKQYLSSDHAAQTRISHLISLFQGSCLNEIDTLITSLDARHLSLTTDDEPMIRAKEIYNRLGGGKPQPKETIPSPKIPPAPTELMPAPSKIPPPPTTLPPELQPKEKLKTKVAKPGPKISAPPITEPPPLSVEPAPTEISPSTPSAPIPPPPPLPTGPKTPGPKLTKPTIPISKPPQPGGKPPYSPRPLPLPPTGKVPPLVVAPTAPKSEESSLQTLTEQLSKKTRLFRPQKILYGFDARDGITIDEEKRKLSAYFGLLGGGPAKKEYLKLYALGPEFVSPDDVAQNYGAFFDGDMKLRYPVEFIKNIETKGKTSITDGGASVTVEQITKLPPPILIEIFDPAKDKKDSIKAGEQLENLQRFAVNFSDTFKTNVVTDGMTKAMAAIKINPISLDPTPKMENNLNTFINTARQFLKSKTSDKKDEEYLSRKLDELNDYKPLLSEENALKAKENFELIRAKLNAIQTTCQTMKEERETLAKTVKGFQSVTREDSDILIKFGCPEGARKLAWAQTCLATIVEDICIKPIEELLQKVTKNTEEIDADKANIEKRGSASKYQAAMQQLYDRLKSDLKKVDPEVEKIEEEVADREKRKKLIEMRKQLEEEPKDEEPWED